jgi:hypothetical protein
MKNLKKTSIGVLAMLLIVLLAGLPASAATEGSQMEINCAGMVSAGLGMGSMGRIGFGYFDKGFGFELGTEAIPGGMFGGLFDGTLVLNPFFEKSVSPVLSIGALVSVFGDFAFVIGGGLRLRLTSKFGLRAEYIHLPALRGGLVVLGAFVNF